MKKMAIAIFAVSIAVCAAIPALAGSLWNDNSESLLSDKKALYAGDIVTIAVNERAQATQNSKSQVKQDEGMSGTDGTGILAKFFNAFNLKATDSYSGQGSTTSGNTLVTTISAQVVEVLPNGNLLIEARRSMVVNAETQTIILSGVIRPQDVARDNTIDSSQIADMALRYEGKGPIAKRQKPGILNKLFDLIF
jgi:flagellar L-ring protein FlgH